jgi:hypothetical protein
MGASDTEEFRSDPSKVVHLTVNGNADQTHRMTTDDDSKIRTP